MSWVGYRNKFKRIGSCVTKSLSFSRADLVWFGSFLSFKLHYGVHFPKKLTLVPLWKCPSKCSEYLKKPPFQTKSARVKLKDLVTHEQRRLNLFRYPTHGIETYLGRGVGRAYVQYVNVAVASSESSDVSLSGSGNPIFNKQPNIGIWDKEMLPGVKR